MRSLLCSGCADPAHSPRRCPLALVLCTLALISTSAAQSQESSTPVEAPTLLQPGKPVERELSPKQVRRFVMPADSGSLVRIGSTQLGIDIVVSIFGADSAKLGIPPGVIPSTSS
jgi:hypothetical protein